MCPAVVILQGIVSERDVKCFYRLGAAGVVKKRDYPAVLDQVRKTLALTQFEAESAKAA